MKPLPGASILAAVIASVAMAQTTPQAPPPTFSPPRQYPSPPAPPANLGAETRNPRYDRQSNVNDCTSWVQANYPRLSAVEVKQYCQRDLYPSSPQD
jgi:hypothetical protein